MHSHECDSSHRRLYLLSIGIELGCTTRGGGLWSCKGRRAADVRGALFLPFPTLEKRLDMAVHHTTLFEVPLVVLFCLPEGLLGAYLRSDRIAVGSGCAQF